MGLKGELFLPRAYQTGEKNDITDVPGIKVGQVTLRKGGVNTGVTQSCPGVIFLSKKCWPAARSHRASAKLPAWFRSMSWVLWRLRFS